MQFKIQNVAIAVLLTVVSTAAQDRHWQRMTTNDGSEVYYALVDSPSADRVWAKEVHPPNNKNIASTDVLWQVDCSQIRLRYIQAVFYYRRPVSPFKKRVFTYDKNKWIYPAPDTTGSELFAIVCGGRQASKKSATKTVVQLASLETLKKTTLDSLDQKITEYAQNELYDRLTLAQMQIVVRRISTLFDWAKTDQEWFELLSDPKLRERTIQLATQYAYAGTDETNFTQYEREIMIRIRRLN